MYLNLAEGLLWVQDVEGSNPFTPTTFSEDAVEPSSPGSMVNNNERTLLVPSGHRATPLSGSSVRRLETRHASRYLARPFISRINMSNRALWDIRKRHVWLSKPQKGKALKRRARVRCGLQFAIDRKAPAADESKPAAE